MASRPTCVLTFSGARVGFGVRRRLPCDTLKALGARATLEDWLRERIGRRVHLFYPPGINVVGKLETLDPMGGWVEITNDQGLRGVLRLEGVMLAEEAPPLQTARAVGALPGSTRDGQR